MHALAGDGKIMAQDLNPLVRAVTNPDTLSPASERLLRCARLL